jgi:hypothetical protein
MFRAYMGPTASSSRPKRALVFHLTLGCGVCNFERRPLLKLLFRVPPYVFKRCGGPEAVGIS